MSHKFEMVRVTRRWDGGLVAYVWLPDSESTFEAKRLVVVAGLADNTDDLVVNL